MTEMRGEVGKETPKKRWIIPYFYDVTWLIFETLCPVTEKQIILERFFRKKKKFKVFSLIDFSTFQLIDKSRFFKFRI